MLNFYLRNKEYLSQIEFFNEIRSICVYELKFSWQSASHIPVYINSRSKHTVEHTGRQKTAKTYIRSHSAAAILAVEHQKTIEAVEENLRS